MGVPRKVHAVTDEGDLYLVSVKKKTAMAAEVDKSVKFAVLFVYHGCEAEQRKNQMTMQMPPVAVVGFVSPKKQKMKLLEGVSPWERY